MDRFFKAVVLVIVGIIVASVIALAYIENHRSIMENRSPITLNIEPDGTK